MIDNPQVGMRVKFTDNTENMSCYFGKTGTIRKLVPSNSAVKIQFDDEIGSSWDHEFFVWRLSPIDPDNEHEDMKRYQSLLHQLEDHKRRKAHADKYL